MEFGVFLLAQQRGYHQTSQQVIKNSIEQTVVAEQAGFDSAWYAEHHFNNYSLSPSPLITIAHAAAKTSRIRLGSAVCILPLYHPARFLAEVGFVDTISDGRLDLGVGSGYQEFEFERFGVKLSEAAEIYNEFLDILPLAFAKQIFEYKGKHISLPPSSIATRPIQSPHPPLWITSGNPLTLQRGIQEGHNLFVSAHLKGSDGIADLRNRLEVCAANCDRDLDNDVKFGFLRCAYASDNSSEIDAYLDNARFQRRISESLKYRRVQSDDGYMIQETPTATDPKFEDLKKDLPVGSVNQVIDKLLEEISVLKPKHIAIQTQLGDFDQRLVLKQLDLWGEKIIPAINKELALAPAL